MSASEISELDIFLAKAASELTQIEEAEKSEEGPRGRPFAEVAKVIAEKAGEKYRDPKNCDDLARRNAQWALQWVRERMASGKPLYPPDREPGLGEVTKAKLIAERCPQGTLTELELAEIDLSLAKFWASVAKESTDEGVRFLKQHFKEAEGQMATGWDAKSCSTEAVSKAKDIIARVSKSETQAK
jgi:hypothetical protein